MYKLRITITAEQLDHDGRVLFSTTDTTDESTIDEAKNTVDVPGTFRFGVSGLANRMVDVLITRYGRPGNRSTAQMRGKGAL